MMRWVIFHIVVLALWSIDLSVSRKREMKPKTALLWSLGWISLALMFNGYVYLADGAEKALQFFTAYLVEKSLSIDNLFVFLMIFSYFKTPKPLQYKVLFLGVIEAFILRLVLILGGVSLIAHFHWVTYLLGAIVAVTGLKLILQKKGTLSIEESRMLRWLRGNFRVTEDYVGEKFFVKRESLRYATPLFLVLMMVESSDLLFAVDSIPAVLSVTKDPFIAYTSNVFAVLGLRSLFFLIAPWFDRLSRLKSGLGAVLLFIGFKMIIAPVFSISLPVSLVIISAILLISVVRSIPRKS